MRNTDKRLLLLGVLRAQKMHGYQLQQFLEKHLAYFPSLKASTAYYTLERMAEEGLVEAQSEQPGNRPVRRVYRITPTGETAFRALLEESLSSFDFGETGDEIGIAFLSALEPNAARALLASKRKRIEARLSEAVKALARLKSVDPAHLALVRVRLRLEADSAWIQEVERSLGGSAHEISPHEPSAPD